MASYFYSRALRAAQLEHSRAEGDARWEAFKARKAAGITPAYVPVIEIERGAVTQSAPVVEGASPQALDRLARAKARVDELAANPKHYRAM